MVQAILEGRKTQTRRVIKAPKNKLAIGFRINSTQDGQHKWPEAIDEHERGLEGNGCNMECPYGKPGDVLWVRETTRRCQHYGFDYEFYQYKDLTTSTHCEIIDKDQIIHNPWTPSIHMKREACRIWLEIVSVRVERLHDISESDAQSEGMKLGKGFTKNICGMSFKAGFRDLWQEINNDPEKPETHWKKNPWVWVVEFKQIEQP